MHDRKWDSSPVYHGKNVWCGKEQSLDVVMPSGVADDFDICPHHSFCRRHKLCSLPRQKISPPLHQCQTSPQSDTPCFIARLKSRRELWQDDVPWRMIQPYKWEAQTVGAEEVNSSQMKLIMQSQMSRLESTAKLQACIWENRGSNVNLDVTSLGY